MGEQYFTQQPISSHDEKIIKYPFKNTELNFKTDSGVFSKDRVDYGSQLLIETFLAHNKELNKAKLLELGSGYGPIAITLGKLNPRANITGVEINERAYQLAIENSQYNQTQQIKWVLADASTIQFDEGFHHVLTNPPIRAGKKLIQKFVSHAHSLLLKEGLLWVVIQKKQGAPSMLAFMEELFGNVEKIRQEKGYWILVSRKVLR